ncbi:MAG: hypothetical protein JXQ84_01525 [Rhodospirillaceae bacterium]|nr:hypothetical protein [Rhodospirillaceae bacterium]
MARDTVCDARFGEVTIAGGSDATCLSFSLFFGFAVFRRSARRVFVRGFVAGVQLVPGADICAGRRCSGSVRVFPYFLDDEVLVNMFGR